MTQGQAETHKIVIGQFIDDPSKGVWSKLKGPTFNGQWKLSYCPSFNTDFHYVYNDEHAEVCKQFLDDPSKVEYNLTSSGWTQTRVTSIGEMIFNGLEHYRIKTKKPKFKVGDWVINTKPPFQQDCGKPSAPFLVEQYWLDHIRKYGKTCEGNTELTGELEHFKLWEPRVGELCVFFNSDEDDHYEIFRFKGHIDFKHVRPFEFLETLDVIEG